MILLTLLIVHSVLSIRISMLSIRVSIVGSIGIRIVCMMCSSMVIMRRMRIGMVCRMSRDSSLVGIRALWNNRLGRLLLHTHSVNRGLEE